jgi:phosphatidylglycerophosphate synthase
MSATTATPSRFPLRRGATPVRARPRDVWRDLALGALPLAAVSVATCRVLSLPTRHLLEAGVLYALLAGLILLNRPSLSRGPGIGPANRVTLVRATLVLPVAALLLRPEAIGERGAWWIIALSIAALLLDGLDGRVARRTGTGSAFGARFDMELDAFHQMALSVLLWQSGKVPPWVLAIGGMRYVFVLAGMRWPVLAGELPPSVRRKVICVVAGVALLVCLGPIVPAALAVLAAASALLLLTWSFAIDVAWLLGTPTRRGR